MCPQMIRQLQQLMKLFAAVGTDVQSRGALVNKLVALQISQVRE